MLFDESVEKTYVDRTYWRSPGAWENEPDLKVWQKPLNDDYLLVITRNPDMGTWLGYVGVKTGHPAYGREGWDDLERILDVHGGITYTKSRPPIGIKSTPEPMWWIGFDCNHFMDIYPMDFGAKLRASNPECDSGIDYFNPESGYFGGGFRPQYRTMGYVIEQVESLYEQLKELTTWKATLRYSRLGLGLTAFWTTINLKRYVYSRRLMQSLTRIKDSVCGWISAFF